MLPQLLPTHQLDCLAQRQTGVTIFVGVYVSSCPAAVQQKLQHHSHPVTQDEPSNDDASAGFSGHTYGSEIEFSSAKM